MQKWGVLFDLDGVIIDSETEYTRIWNRINEEFPTGVENFATKIKGTTLDSILGTYYPEPELRSRVEARLYEEEAKMQYNYCAGARRLLDALIAVEVPIALFTSSNSLKMEHLYVDHPELRNTFNVIITGELVARSKPAPDGYILAASELNLPSERCIVVEDSLQGVKAGSAAGGKVVGVAGTLSADILAPHSDKVVNSLEELSVDILKDIISGE